MGRGVCLPVLDGAQAGISFAAPLVARRRRAAVRRREGTLRKRLDFSAGCSCALVSLMLLATPASATDSVTLCHQALSADVLKYTDSQFKSTLCTASIVYQRAAKAGDHEAMSVCMKAIEKMIPDFARRFPGRKPHEVVGRCE
jgi:hypothetical protein